MRSTFLVGALFSSLLFWGSCTQKTKTEQPVQKDSTQTAVKKVEPEKKAEEPKKEEPPPVQKPVEKKQEKVATPNIPAKKEPAKPMVQVQEPKKEEPKKEPVKEVVVAPPVKEPVKETVPVKEPEKKIEPPKVDSSALKKPEEKPKGKAYYFKVVRKEDGKEIAGNLQLQEAVGASQFQLVKSGQTVYLPEPTNRRGAYNVVALLPGYRQSSLIFGWFNPPLEKGPNNEDMITITLEKARRGDYVDFNNVHFFKNTSIMRPVSQAELDELVYLMKESLNYKIKIYGYCNGTQTRESYTMGTSKDYFALDPKKNKKETISSKALSEARAENVKAYLVQQGIAADRISTKGEGGKVPLYLESGTLAQYNDRVEVEFVKH